MSNRPFQACVTRAADFIQFYRLFCHLLTLLNQLWSVEYVNTRVNLIQMFGRRAAEALLADQKKSMAI